MEQVFIGMGKSKHQQPTRIHVFKIGMGRYEKYVDRDVANAKPYRIRDSAF